MLSTAKTLKGYRLEGLDGEIGKVKEFYFDDRHWTIRYLVADTGYLLPDRQVLISPYSLVAMNGDIFQPQIKINLTKAQIKASPSLDNDKPVSRQFEEEFYSYHSWPRYWAGPYSWGSHGYIDRDREEGRELPHAGKPWDYHLRSTHEVSGYHAQAKDGDIGNIEDFVIDDETWAIRYLIVTTTHWWLGKKVLVSPRWIQNVSWDEQKVVFNLSREAIKQSPEYTADTLLTRDYEAKLHQHYDRQGYWEDELAAK
jgi:uncharacterized protein YrrD